MTENDLTPKQVKTDAVEGGLDKNVAGCGELSPGDWEDGRSKLVNNSALITFSEYTKISKGRGPKLVKSLMTRPCGFPSFGRLVTL